MRFKRGFTLSVLVFLAAFSIASSTSAADSNASITFTPGDGAPPILDPSDPTTPYDPNPENPTDPQDPATGETGPLTLDYVSSVHFGKQPIESGIRKYESTTLRPFIQVTDRRGTGEGWNVTAQMSNFTSGVEQTLPGAVLTFSNGVVDTNGTSTPPTPNGQIVLNAGGSTANVVAAEKDAGLGSWITRWFPTKSDVTENNNVTLEVPAGAATLGDHTAVITWTLTAGPGQ